jgi:hypothetical protein
MKKYIIKHSFLIFSIAIYCTPFICSFSIYQVFLLIEKSELRSIDCSALYIHPTFWLGYLDIAVGLISIIGSAFIARVFWDLSRYHWVKWTSCIIVFVTLFGFSISVPWFETNSRQHKNRVLLAIMNEIREGDKEEIAIRFNYKLRQINMFGENRDFDIYEIENISNDSVLSKIELPINSIKIQAPLLKIPVDEMHGKIIISKNQKKNFCLMDRSNNILGIDLEIIKNNP